MKLQDDLLVLRSCSVFGVLVFPYISSFFNKLRVQGCLDMATTLTSWRENGKPHKLRAKVSSSGYLEGCQPLRYCLSPSPFLLSSLLSPPLPSLAGSQTSQAGLRTLCVARSDHEAPALLLLLLALCWDYRLVPPHLPFPLPAPPPSLPLKSILNTGGKQI